MKKIFAVLLAALIIATMSVTAFAADVTLTNDLKSTDAPVDADYVAGSEAEAVYKVDIAWGSLAFSYQEAKEGTWNPATHEYDGVVAAGWSCAADANKITVTNHSNVAVDAGLTYAAKEGYTEIVGKFYSSTDYTVENITAVNVATAVETAVDKAPAASAYLMLNGTNEAFAEATEAVTIGTVTVALD